jgi:hypothetical protein
MAKLWSSQVGQAGRLFPNLQGVEAVAAPAGKVILSSKTTFSPLSTLATMAVSATAANGARTVGQETFGWPSARSPFGVLAGGQRRRSR